MNFTLKNSATITEKRIASSKGLQLICAILALLLDSLVIGILLINSTEIKFLICPCLIALLDLIFIVKVVFSNYRFSYALNGALIHALVIVLVAIFAFVGTGLLEKRVIFVDFALYAMPAVHLLQSLAVLVTAFHAAKTGKTLQKTAAILLTALFVGGTAVYGNFLLNDGFFGQGVKMEDLTVTYSLSDDKSSYVVTGALKGKGNTVTVPEEFNGLPVSAIDTAVFTDEKIDFVVLGCGTDIEFLNASSMAAINPDLRVLVPKAEMDTIRETFYEFVPMNGEMLALANTVYPSNLTDSEVFVTVRYNSDTLALANGEIIPTWFGTKGSTYDVSDFADVITYVEKSNKTNELDLYWSYHNMDTLIFDAVVDETGKDLSGRIISASAEADLSFEKIFRVEITEDNDDRYTIDENIRFIKLEEENYEYKLATADRVQEILDAMPARDGFIFGYYTGSDNHLFNVSLLQDELDAILAAGDDCFTLRPVWDLKAPTITEILADGVKTGHVAIYGSDVSLTSSATSPAESISLRYTWTFTNTVATSASFTLANIHPADAGVYTLTVTAYSDSVTSLEKAISETITVGFAKKELNFIWELPSDTIYSATNKKITGTFDSGDIINGDVINFGLSGCSTATDGSFFVRNAGTYTISAILKGDADTKYFVADVDKERTLSITPHSLSVTWEDVNEFVYNGQNQSPNATATGLGEDGELILNLSGKGLTVGSYNVTATTTNTNYTLTENVKAFTITKRPITVTAWGQTSLVYNGVPQNVKVTSVENAVSGEQNTILQSILYTGDGINVGTYSTTASLPAESNYYFSEPPSSPFSITPKAMTITIDNKTHVYDGHTYTNFTFQYSGKVDVDSIGEILYLNYKDEAVSAINVRESAYTIDADVIGLEKYLNYTVTLQTGTLKINQRALSVTIDNASMVYNGQRYTNFSFKYNNLAETDTIDEVFTMSYGGAAISAVNAGTDYAITGSANAQAKYGNYKITITPAKLDITPAPLDVTAVGGTKVYDGTVPTNFSIIVVGLVNGETEAQLGTPRYSGAATTTKNVGEHTLKVSFAANNVTKNYEIAYHDGTYTITKRDLTITVSGGEKIYDGVQGGSFSISASGLINSETVANLGTPIYSGSATTAKNVGVYELSVTLPANTYTNNYNITYVDGLFQITPKSVTVTVATISKIYDGQVGGNFSFTISGLVSSDQSQQKTILGTATYTGAATTNKDVGTYSYTVFFSGNDNYNIASILAGELTINKKSITVTPTATSKEYDGQVGGSFDYSVSGLVSGEFKEILGTAIFGGSATTAKDVGTYALTISIATSAAANNYTISYSQASFTISKKALTVTAIAPADKEYDGQTLSGFSFIASGLVSGESLSNPIYGGSATTAKNAGTYELTVAFNTDSVTKNYQITYQKDSVTITKKNATVTAIAPANKVYDGQVLSGFSFSATGLVNGESLLNPIYGSTAVNAKNVGLYELTVSFDQNGTAKNYNITYVSDSVEITKKNATVTAVVPASKVYDGQVLSSFSFLAEGLVAGDTLTNPIYSGSATSAKNVGVYELSVSFDPNGVAKNYNITYVSATTEITKKNLTVTAVAPANKEYDGQELSGFSFHAEGLANGDSLTNPIYGGSAVGAKNAGTYVLSVSFDQNTVKNYNVIYVSSSVEISKRKLTVTATATDRLYAEGSKGGEFSVTMEGLANGDSAEAFGAPIFSGTAVNAEAAGTYVLSVELSASELLNNYDVTYVSDTDFVISMPEEATTTEGV